MVTKTTLAGRAANRVDDIPAALTTAVVEEYIEDSHVEVENYTGDTFSTSDIPTRYQPILIDMAEIKILGYMITHDISLGGITISAGNRGGIRRKIELVQIRIDKAMITPGN